MVQLKRKVTLKQKTVDTFPEEKKSSTDKVQSSKKNLNWVYLVLVILLLVGGYFLFGNKETSMSSTEKELVQNAEIKQNELPKDSIVVIEKNDTDKPVEVSEKVTNEQSAYITETVEKESNEDVENSDTRSLLSGTLNQKAIAVIRGDFGNGEERKVNLGKEYLDIQNKVNEMYKKGLVH